MNLLVTGGAGFIGSNFIRYWLKTHPEDNLTNLDALTYAGNLENLQDIKDNPHYTFVKGDITDPDIVSQVIKDSDIVVHFAAETHVDRSIQGPSAFVQTNVQGTLVLLEAAKQNQTRFHHVSTDEVFGSLKLNSPEKFSESTPYDPSSPYSASKAASDHLVRAYHRTYNLPITISNTSNNFGPYQFPEKFIPLAITNLLEDKPVPIYGQGNQVRDWLYVLDHCRGIDLILQKGKIGQTYLLGGMTQDITNLQVAHKLLKLLGKDDALLQTVKDRPGHDVRYALDWTKAQDELGYQPEHSFDDYLKETVSWYQVNPIWWQSVKSGAYQDYYKKQYQP